MPSSARSTRQRLVLGVPERQRRSETILAGSRSKTTRTGAQCELGDRYLVSQAFSHPSVANRCLVGRCVYSELNPVRRPLRVHVLPPDQLATGPARLNRRPRPADARILIAVQLEQSDAAAASRPEILQTVPDCLRAQGLGHGLPRPR